MIISTAVSTRRQYYLVFSAIIDRDLALEYSKSYTRRVRVRGASRDRKFFPAFHSKDDEETSPLLLLLLLLL
jgi:hypothetical protein